MDQFPTPLLANTEVVRAIKPTINSALFRQICLVFRLGIEGVFLSDDVGNLQHGTREDSIRDVAIRRFHQVNLRRQSDYVRHIQRVRRVRRYSFQGQASGLLSFGNEMMSVCHVIDHAASQEDCVQGSSQRARNANVCTVLVGVMITRRLDNRLTSAVRNAQALGDILQYLCVQDTFAGQASQAQDRCNAFIFTDRFGCVPRAISASFPDRLQLQLNCGERRNNRIMSYISVVLSRCENGRVLVYCVSCDQQA